MITDSGRYGDIQLGDRLSREPLRILVASQNEVKRLAVIQGALDFYDDIDLDVDLSQVEISSGVSDQPMSLQETRLGVVNRINAIKDIGGYMLYAAVEGGVHQIEGRWYETACAGVLKGDKLGIAFGVGYPIPENIAKHIEQGMDLNQAVELETGIKNIGKSTKHKGFNGWLTDGKLDRQLSSAQAIHLALRDIKHN